MQLQASCHSGASTADVAAHAQAALDLSDANDSTGDRVCDVDEASAEGLQDVLQQVAEMQVRSSSLLKRDSDSAARNRL